MPIHETTIERDIEVEYNIIPASKGSRDSYGVPMEPDESADIEILQVRDAKTRCTFELTTEQEDKLKEEIAEDLSAAEDWPDVERD